MRTRRVLRFLLLSAVLVGVVVAATAFMPMRPSGDCWWVCTNTVVHPGHEYQPCLAGAAIACTLIPNRFYAAACMAASYGYCYVPAWKECTQYKGYCGVRR